jgi:hypothetical protein
VLFREASPSKEKRKLRKSRCELVTCSMPALSKSVLLEKLYAGLESMMTVENTAMPTLFSMEDLRTKPEVVNAYAKELGKFTRAQEKRNNCAQLFVVF